MRVTVVGSPPYAASLHQQDVDGIERAIATGKHTRASLGNPGPHSQLNHSRQYGIAAGQLGALPSGSLDARPVPATGAPVTTWHGCYGDSWQDLIVPEAFAHPAKFARGLIHRIYRHLLERGYVRQGDVVLDCFGGVGLGALDAMTYGLSWVGCELEERFCRLGEQNLDLWRQRYGFTGGTIVQGDSRRLRAVLAGAQVQAVVGSPPYAGALNGQTNQDAGDRTHVQARGRNPDSPASGYPRHYGYSPGQLGAMPPGTVQAVVGSPPYAESLADSATGTAQIARLKAAIVRDGNGHAGSLTRAAEYGTTPGQLGAMPPGQVQAVVSSPPWNQSLAGGEGVADRANWFADRPKTQANHHGGKVGRSINADYDSSPGQLGAMPPGALVSSPPYAGAGEVLGTHNGIDYAKAKEGGKVATPARQASGEGYGTSAGQLGAMPPGAVVSRNIASTKNHDRINHTVLSDSKEDACQPVRTAELLSHVEVDGVSHAVESTLAQRSKDAQSQQDMEPRLPLLATISPCRTVGASRTHNGQAADLPGEAMHGTSSGALPLSVTNSPACNAAALSACKSIISSIKTQRAVCGITNSITWKRSVQDVTLGTTEESSSWRVVPFVEPGLRELPERKPALMPVGLKLEDVRPGHTTVCTREPLSVLPVALPCPTEANGINTVLMPVGAQQRTLSDAPNESSTFWGASAQIMAELAALLPAGAVCAWVVKAYVKNKAIVPFPQQWQALCEAHGFVLVEEIHASLVEDHGTQEGLFGESTQVRTEKKSFFRRLAEKKGSPRIDYETVLIVRKAGDVGGVCVVSSPPWTDTQPLRHGTEELLAQVAQRHGNNRQRLDGMEQQGYGTTPGNLGNLPVGVCCVSSPPFGEQNTGGGLAVYGTPSQQKHGMRSPVGYVNQGTTPGNLGNLPVGVCVVSSPPYAVGCVHETGQDPAQVRDRGTTATPWGTRAHGDSLSSYGTTPGNLGNLPVERSTPMAKPKSPSKQIIEDSMREVFDNPPSTVKPGQSAEATRKQKVAIGLEKSRKAGATVPRKSSKASY